MEVQVFKATELRHPVAFLQGGEFVPNDIDLGLGNFTVITGPNMGGKSTIIRQASPTPLLLPIFTQCSISCRFWAICMEIRVRAVVKIEDKLKDEDENTSPGRCLC